MTTQTLQFMMALTNQSLTIQKPWPDRVIARDYRRKASETQAYVTQQFSIAPGDTEETLCKCISDWFDSRL